MVPVTAAGRAIAFVLMLGGIAFFSGVTANLASFLVKGSDDTGVKISKLTDEIKELKQQISDLMENRKN